MREWKAMENLVDSVVVRRALFGKSVVVQRELGYKVGGYLSLKRLGGCSAQCGTAGVGMRWGWGRRGVEGGGRSAGRRASKDAEKGATDA